MYKMDEYGPNQQLILEALKLPELETNIQILNQVNLDCAQDQDHMDSQHFGFLDPDPFFFQCGFASKSNGS